ncbi:hypothetical protein BD769DRAFT_1428079 [Suillus cothurnatus]|nr:hypothetical protein BD769DRAFT_1428079 [Suillus cothurnatus]
MRLFPDSFNTSSTSYSPGVLDEEPSIELMKAAWDLDVDTIDTTNMYSNSESASHR